MTTPAGSRTPLWPSVALIALSLSIGWGIRGNFGHEIGAMMPGALAAMAAVLMSGRADWWRRVAFFGCFGALGWSFGGSMSYMQVIAYTHSGHSGSVLYGFACLFLIGFLWAAVGGAGTALPACLERDRLTEMFPPIAIVLGAWVLQDFVENDVIAVNADFRQTSPLYWYDTDWLAALVAIVAVGLLALVRRRWDGGSSLILHMAVGWWIGFLGLVVGLGWRMTPPRGDNWAGCLGMVGGLLLWLARQQLTGALRATLVTGFIGGFGFATATMLKLVEVRSGWQTNWHSVLEQTYGLINGVGVAVAMLWLARTTPRVNDEPARRRWTDYAAIGFVLLGVTWLNLRRNPSDWVKAKAFPEVLYGWPATTWFNLAYLALAVAVILVLRRHARRPLALVPASWLGRGQWLYLIFLWWVVVGNFERALGSFAPQRLITEGVIHVNAVLCTLLVLLATPAAVPGAARAPLDFRPRLRRVVALGLAGCALTVFADWSIVRGLYGDEFAGHANRHIRFGPQATATTEKPAAGQPHP